MSDEYLMTGSYGLDKDEWQSVFYDDELPPDWRAAYYSTLLRSVYLPASEWQRAAENNWLEEVDEEFKFVLSVSTADEVLGLLRNHSDFAARVAGVVLKTRDAANQPLLIKELAAIQGKFPLCLDAGPVDYIESGLDSFCVDAGVGGVWYPSAQLAPLPSGDFLVTLISDEGLPEQREIVAGIQQWMNGKRRAGLFNTSEIDAPLRAQETRILAELMGV